MSKVLCFLGISPTISSCWGLAFGVALLGNLAHVETGKQGVVDAASAESKAAVEPTVWGRQPKPGLVLLSFLTAEAAKGMVVIAVASLAVAVEPVVTAEGWELCTAPLLMPWLEVGLLYPGLTFGGGVPGAAVAALLDPSLGEALAFEAGLALCTSAAKLESLSQVQDINFKSSLSKRSLLTHFCVVLRVGSLG